MIWKNPYPRSTEGRIKLGQHGFHKSRAFLRAAAKNFLLLQLLFLALFAYVFGALFQQGSHTHNITVVFVDYDRGAIGEAVRRAYTTLQRETFPTLIELPASGYPSPNDLQSSVCSTSYWAALYVTAGASDRLGDALGGGSAAQSYNRSDVLTFIWNEVRYSAIIDAVIASNLQTLSSAARVAYMTTNGTGQIRSVSNADGLAVLANPWELVSVNLRPTTQGSRAIYNTIVIILIMIQEFFYLGVINGLYLSFKIYARIHPSRVIVVRTLNSLAYTLVGSLCTAGAIWAFKSGWDVGAPQFGATWMVLWLFAHLNFLTLDVFTAWLPHAYVPMSLITWIILNVTAILLPFELSPGFYRFGYAFPAHEVYQVLLDIWSRGCNPRLHVALPVMFAWEVVGLVLSGLAVFRRSHYATLADEAAARQFDERVEAAMEFERAREREEKMDQEQARARKPAGEKEEEPADAAEDAERTDSNIRRELSKVIRTEDARIYKERRASKTCNFGPSFSLPFDAKDDESSVSDE